jgi:hypothetical protein
MSGAAAQIDSAQLAALSERLGIAPRRLLIAAARLAQAEPQRKNDPAFLREVLEDARDDDAVTESAARLLLTPIADYAINDLDRLFASLWPDVGERQGV